MILPLIPLQVLIIHIGAIKGGKSVTIFRCSTESSSCDVFLVWTKDS
jgi:hypothetical protein